MAENTKSAVADQILPEFFLSASSAALIDDPGGGSALWWPRAAIWGGRYFARGSQMLPLLQKIALNLLVNSLTNMSCTQSTLSLRLLGPSSYPKDKLCESSSSEYLLERCRFLLLEHPHLVSFSIFFLSCSTLAESKANVDASKLPRIGVPLQGTNAHFLD